jgi:hypothetical protein
MGVAIEMPHLWQPVSAIGFSFHNILGVHGIHLLDDDAV